MKRLYQAAALALATVAILAALATADTHTLKLKDGRILRGEFQKANKSELWFTLAGETSPTRFDIADVISLHLSSATVQPMIQREEPVKVPEGTPINIRLDSELTTSGSSAGDKFFATLVSDVRVGDEVVVSAGKRITGRVRKVVKPKRKGSRSVIEMVLVSIPVDGKSMPVVSNYFGVESDGQGTINATGTARPVGVTIGAFLDDRNVRLPMGTEIEFSLKQPLIIRPGS